MREKDIPLDVYHYHEMLDRLSVHTDIINMYILQHPVSKHYPQLSDLIEEALNKLLDAYHLAANLSDMDSETSKQNFSIFEDSTFSQFPPEFFESTRTDNINI